MRMRAAHRLCVLEALPLLHSKVARVRLCLLCILSTRRRRRLLVPRPRQPDLHPPCLQLGPLRFLQKRASVHDVRLTREKEMDEETGMGVASKRGWGGGDG